jgi:hypothetical protein
VEGARDYAGSVMRGRPIGKNDQHLARQSKHASMINYSAPVVPSRSRKEAYHHTRSEFQYQSCSSVAVMRQAQGPRVVDEYLLIVLIESDEAQYMILCTSNCFLLPYT